MAPGERRRRSVIAKLVELAIALLVVLTPASALALTRASVVENASALAALHAKTRVRGFELAPAEIASGFELSSARNASGKSARGRGEGVRVHHRNRVWSPELGAFLSPDEFGYVTTEGTLWSWPNQNPIAIRDPTGRGELQNYLDAASDIPIIGFLFAGPSAFGHGVQNRVEGTLKLANDATVEQGLAQRAKGNCQIAIGAMATSALADIAVGAAEAAPGLGKTILSNEVGSFLARAASKRKASVRALGGRGRFKSVGDSLDQLEGIEGAQRELRSIGQGEKIRSVEKSQQRVKNDLKKIQSLDDLDPDDDF